MGGRAEVTEETKPFTVLVEPAAQPWPLPGECLVGDLEAVVTGDDKAGAHEHVDDMAVVGVGHDRARIDPLPHRLAVGGGRHQAHEEGLGQEPLVGWEPLVEPLG